MSTNLSIVPDVAQSNPDIEGLSISGSEWKLDVDLYETFITEATGISPSRDLSGSDCYRIGNRLQALIEKRKRCGEWDQTLVEAYSGIETLEQFLWIARFFRACYECHPAEERCFPGHTNEESGISPR